MTKDWSFECSLFVPDLFFNYTTRVKYNFQDLLENFKFSVSFLRLLIYLYVLSIIAALRRLHTTRKQREIRIHFFPRSRSFLSHSAGGFWKLEEPGSKEFVLATWPRVGLPHVFSLSRTGIRRRIRKERSPSWLLGSFSLHIVTCFSAGPQS